MEQVYLCGRTAQKPYYMRELGISLWSAEELSYCIWHNALLIDEDFFSEELFSFLRDELQLGQVADKLNRYYSGPNDRDSALIMLLREIGYYGEADISRFQDLLSRQRRLGPVERMKEKGDLLTRKKRYESAIRAYSRILTKRREYRLSPAACGTILQHMGVAYLRMGYAEEAMECLQGAWNETHNEVFLEQMYELCAQQELPFPPELEAITGSQIAGWEKKYIRAEEKNQYASERSEIVCGLLSVRGQDADRKRRQQIAGFLEEEKKRYCRMALVQ